MAITREASATWRGNINDGDGHIELDGDVISGRYTLAGRLGENGHSMDPERLIAGAQAGCYAMALAKELAGEGFTPSSIEVSARVHLEKDGDTLFIPTVDIIAHAYVDNLSADKFDAISWATLEHCPVAKLLAAAELRLEAHHYSP